jgi:hypothetical protein
METTSLILAKNQELVEHLTNEDPTPIKYITPYSNNTKDSDIFVSKLTKEYVQIVFFVDG